MKTLTLLLLMVIAAGSVQAGVIPYSLIQEQGDSEMPGCDAAHKKHSEMLKRISELRKEEDKCLEELKGMEKGSCK